MEKSREIHQKISIYFQCPQKIHMIYTILDGLSAW